MINIDVLPGFIMGFREGLEAFLVIIIMISYLRKSKREAYINNVYFGLSIGVITSLIFGALLYFVATIIGDIEISIVKLWESSVSLIALILISTFIFWMMKHRHGISKEISNKVELNPSKIGVTILAALMVAREGAEIVLFVFTSVNRYSYLIGSILGIIVSMMVVILISKSLIKINLKVIFNVTLVYLILQAGFLLGYSIHELLSYFKDNNILESTNLIYTKLFDFSNTFLDHKESIVGIVLYATIGWYSKPEIIQFIIQYVYTGVFLYLFFKTRK